MAFNANDKPISSLNVGPITGVVSVSGTVSVAYVDGTTTGSITGSQNLDINTEGYATVGLVITGSWSGSIRIQGSVDGSNFDTTTAASLNSGTLGTTLSSNGSYQINCSALKTIRILGATVTGTATLTLRKNATAAMIMLDNPIPSGNNVIGQVIQSGAWTVAVNQASASATAWPVFTSQVVSATITGFVSVSNTVTVTGTVTALVTGFVSVSNTVTVTGNVSVSGSVAVNQGAASASAGWPVFLGGASAASGYQMSQNTALSNTVVNVKASSGNVYGYHFYNPNENVAYVQMFKVTAASVTLSSTVAVRTLAIPAKGWVDGQAGPLAFASGIAMASTVSASGSTANSTSILANVDYY